MKWEIFHSTRYDYATAVRDSVNNVCLQPMPIPEQSVESFILKVIPASRLTHSHDLYSNRISRFEITEPHNSLLIEAQSRVNTRPPAPLPATEKLCSFAAIQTVTNIENLNDYLQASRRLRHGWDENQGVRLAARSNTGHTGLPGEAFNTPLRDYGAESLVGRAIGKTLAITDLLSRCHFEPASECAT